MTTTLRDRYLSPARPSAAIINPSVIAALGARAEWAWRMLFESSGSQIAAFARGCGHASCAEDVLGETFARAYAAIDRFEGDERALRAWLYAIARNVMRDTGRRSASAARTSRRLLAVRQEDLAGNPEATTVERDAIHELLAPLSERQREVMVLRVVDDLSVDEVAYITRMSPGSVKVHQRRAERRMRQLLERKAS